MKKTMGLIGAVMAALGIAGCSSEQSAVSAAREAGWSEIRVVDKSPINFRCDAGEMAYRIIGRNPAGRNAEATVCCGYTKLKGCTMRY